MVRRDALELPLDPVERLALRIQPRIGGLPLRTDFRLDGCDLLPELRLDGRDLLPELQLGGARILLGRNTPRNSVAQALGNRLGLGFLQPTFFSRRAAAVKVSNAKLAGILARNLTRELRIQIDRPHEAQPLPNPSARKGLRPRRVQPPPV